MNSSLIRRIAVRVERPLMQSDEVAVRLACNLAKEAGASVQALAYATNVLSSQTGEVDGSLASAKAELEAWAQEAGAPIVVHDRTNFAEGIGETFATLLQLCDLGILGVPEQQSAGFRMIASTAIFNGGPVLFLPENKTPPNNFSRIMVGWKTGAAASRALKAAIALAGTDSEIIIAQIEEPNTLRADELGIEATHFAAAHGVRAHFHAIPAQGRNAHAALVAAAEEFEADVLATGAIRHGPIHQSLFGSVTRDILEDGFDRPTLLVG